jgi:uncharacterized protein
MQLHHSFEVPAPIDRAWTVLRDVERIGPCMPGATVESVDGDSFTGRVKVKLGPMQITYKGEAAFTEVDEQAHRAVITAKGKETRGTGTADATVTAELTESDGGTAVSVVTDLAITGRPAQFGRGVMADIGDKLLGQFADCLAERLGQVDEAPTTGVTDAAGAGSAAPPEVPPAFARMGVEEQQESAVDLLEVAGQPVLKRLAPAALVALLVWLAARLLRRRGRAD